MLVPVVAFTFAGDVPKFSVQMLPTEGLTPCIAKKGRSRSKGRRVTICQETTESNLQLDAHQNMSIERRKRSLSRKSSVGGLTYAMNPCHLQTFLSSLFSIHFEP